MFEDYAIACGHNPNSPTFPVVVEQMKDLAKYIASRGNDPKDSMYSPIIDKTGSM